MFFRNSYYINEPSRKFEHLCLGNDFPQKLSDYLLKRGNHSEIDTFLVCHLFGKCQLYSSNLDNWVFRERAGPISLFDSGAIFSDLSFLMVVTSGLTKHTSVTSDVFLIGRFSTNLLSSLDDAFCDCEWIVACRFFLHNLCVRPTEVPFYDFLFCCPGITLWQAQTKKLNKYSTTWTISNTNFFWTTFLFWILVLTFFILKLDCNHHTSDHAVSRDSISRFLESTDLILKWRQFLVL